MAEVPGLPIIDLKLSSKN